MTDRATFDPNAPIENIAEHMKTATKFMRLLLIRQHPEKARPGELEQLERELQT